MPTPKPVLTGANVSFPVGHKPFMSRLLGVLLLPKLGSAEPSTEGIPGELVRIADTEQPGCSVRVSDNWQEGHVPVSIHQPMSQHGPG